MTDNLQLVEFEVGPAWTRSGSGAITGVLAVRVDQTVFPETGWLDYVDILEWWAEAIENPNRATLRFMDGPFELQLQTDRRGDDVTTLSFVRRTASGFQVVNEARVDVKQFIHALADACAVAASGLSSSGYPDDSRRFREIANRIGSARSGGVR